MNFNTQATTTMSSLNESDDMRVDSFRSSYGSSHVARKSQKMPLQAFFY
jgi:hypothetical protein